MTASAATPCAVSRTTPNAARSLFLTGALRIRQLSPAPGSNRSRSNSAARYGRPHHIWNAVGSVTIASPKATAERTMSPHDKSGGGGSENIRPSWRILPDRQVVLIIPFRNGLSVTLAQMRDTVARLVGRSLLYRDLIADNGLASGARGLRSGCFSKALASLFGVAPTRSRSRLIVAFIAPTR